MSKLQLPRPGVVAMREKAYAIAHCGAGDPISLIAAEIHRGCWPAGVSGGRLLTPIQNMCQCGMVYKTTCIQLVINIALHQVDSCSCLFRRHQLK
jgi:hypothetical protein